MEQELNNKLQITNGKQYQNHNNQGEKRYDLEERTLSFAKIVGNYVKRLPKSITNVENGKQLVRAAGSIGANYIEANEALGKKDFGMRVRISRKEAKESRFWLELTEPLQADLGEKSWLIKESTELVKIFSAILIKCSYFKYWYLMLWYCLLFGACYL